MFDTKSKVVDLSLLLAMLVIWKAVNWTFTWGPRYEGPRLCHAAPSFVIIHNY